LLTISSYSNNIGWLKAWHQAQQQCCLACALYLLLLLNI
jgi:hypothetical protein